MLLNNKCQSTCSDDKYLYDGKCYPCAENCLSCDEQGCLECNDSTVLVKKQCKSAKSCPDHCDKCDDPSECISCQSGFFLF